MRLVFCVAGLLICFSCYATTGAATPVKERGMRSLSCEAAQSKLLAIMELSEEAKKNSESLRPLQAF
jgi:hypothetical protein